MDSYHNQNSAPFEGIHIDLDTDIEVAGLITQDTAKDLLKAAEARAAQGRKFKATDDNPSSFDEVDLGFPDHPEQGIANVSYTHNRENLSTTQPVPVARITKVEPSGNSNMRTEYMIKKTADGLQVERYVSSLGLIPSAEIPENEVPMDTEVDSSVEPNLTMEDLIKDIVTELLPDIVRTERAKADERTLALPLVPEQEARDLINFIEQAEVLPSTFE